MFYWNIVRNIVEVSMTEDNIHKSCENYSESKDFCLKWFEENVSERYKVCREYSEFDDSKLQRKWSN